MRRGIVSLAALLNAHSQRCTSPLTRISSCLHPRFAEACGAISDAGLVCCAFGLALLVYLVSSSGLRLACILAPPTLPRLFSRRARVCIDVCEIPVGTCAMDRVSVCTSAVLCASLSLRPFSCSLTFSHPLILSSPLRLFFAPFLL
eukprot:2429964-Pleurochrysis_carterae.AAC.2